MTRGDQLLKSVPLKDHFYDAHERRSYLRAVEVAKRIVDDPSALRRGREFLHRFARNDPYQRPSYELWTKTLQLRPEDIARRLLEDSETGQALRDSAPVFVVISEEEAKRLWRARS